MRSFVLPALAFVMLLVGTLVWALHELPDSRAVTTATGSPPPARTVASDPPRASPLQSPGAVPRVRATTATRAAPATKPFAFTRRPSQVAAAASCGFHGLTLPADAKVLAAGAYGGARQDFQIDQSGHQATLMDVAVNHPDTPVVLMLGSYEPTVWRIGWTPGTHIVAAMVSGYHRQVVTGLPGNVPVLVSTHEDKGPCGYLYVTRDHVDRLNPMARRLFGRPVSMVYLAREGQVTVGSYISATAPLVTDRTARAPRSFRQADALMAGPAGLQQAVRKGFLREARQSDVDAWFAAVRKHVHRDVPPIAGAVQPRRMPMIHGYVVLKAFTLPAGLYGADSSTFFVPKGVPRPAGALGHSSLYDFNTLTCAGVMCGHFDQ